MLAVLRPFCFLFLFIFLTSLPKLSALNQPFDHSAWDQFLKKYVNEEGAFNFEAAQKDPSLLDLYLQQINALSYEEVSEDWPREEKLALMMNLYHAVVIKVILEKYPIQSIQHIPGIWQIDVVDLGDQKLSLEEIRDRELIGFFRDEKIYTALACSAKSCPKFPKEAYTGPRVEGQLFLATREFVNSETYNKIVPGEKKIWISKIFEWHAKDFNLDFGPYDAEDIEKWTSQERAVLSFLAYYLEDADKIEYLEGHGYKIKYLPFDWSLNQWKTDSVAN